MVAPANARHFTISSSAGKHGDIWAWTMPDGRSAYRMSMSLRGWITETDQTILNGPDGTPTADRGSRLHRFGRCRRDLQRRSGRRRPLEDLGRRRLGAGRAASAIRPMAARGWRASRTSPRWSPRATRASTCCRAAAAACRWPKRSRSPGPTGPRTLQLAFIEGHRLRAVAAVARFRQQAFSASPGGMGLLPAGYEGGARAAEDGAGSGDRQAGARRVARASWRPPTHPDADRPRQDLRRRRAAAISADRAVLVADGKIAAVGAAGSLKAPAGATTIDGARQDAGARPVGFAPARRRRRLEPDPERRHRNAQLSQPGLADRGCAEHRSSAAPPATCWRPTARSRSSSTARIRSRRRDR